MREVKVSTPILWLVGLLCLVGGCGLVRALDYVLDDYESLFLFRPIAVAATWLVFAWYRHYHYRAVNWNITVGFAIFIVCSGFMGAEYWRIFMSAHYRSNEAACISNVKQLTLGVLQYTQDWDEKLPPATHWATLTQTYVKQASSAPVWRCRDASSPYSYAFNRAIGGHSVSDVEDSADTVMLFESDAAIWNAIGGAQNRVAPGRHGESSIYGLLDGHARRYHDSVSSLRWQPLLSSTEPKPEPSARLPEGERRK